MMLCAAVVSPFKVCFTIRFDVALVHVWHVLRWYSQAITDLNCSPDAFVQLSFQLAYYRLYGEVCSTYETVMVGGAWARADWGLAMFRGAQALSLPLPCFLPSPPLVEHQQQTKMYDHGRTEAQRCCTSEVSDPGVAFSFMFLTCCDHVNGRNVLRTGVEFRMPTPPFSPRGVCAGL